MMEHQTEKREKSKINIWTTNGLEFPQMSDTRPQIQKLREEQTGKVWTKQNKKTTAEPIFSKWNKQTKKNNQR